ncbi:MAG: RraA family protein [Lachnospiraceae bacterium]|nr:RraA family protein [Lachnospiraceae bacterium]
MNAKDFLGIPTGNICDSNGLKGSMDAAIMPMDLHMEMAGIAMTVKCPPEDNLTLHKAIALAKPGTVLVVDCDGYTGCGIFGELFATSCKARGIAGIVIDGACRDKVDLIEMNFPTFARGVNPNGSRKEVLGAIDEPICCGGVTVNAGDIIIGDADGVVVIAKEKAEEVLKKAQAKKQKESELKPLLAQGKTTVELLGFAKKCGMEE